MLKLIIFSLLVLFTQTASAFSIQDFIGESFNFPVDGLQSKMIFNRDEKVIFKNRDCTGYGPTRVVADILTVAISCNDGQKLIKLMFDLSEFHNDVKQFDAEISINNRQWIPIQIQRGDQKP